MIVVAWINALRWEKFFIYAQIILPRHFNSFRTMFDMVKIYPLRSITSWLVTA